MPSRAGASTSSGAKTKSPNPSTGKLDEKKGAVGLKTIVLGRGGGRLATKGLLGRGQIQQLPERLWKLTCAAGFLLWRPGKRHLCPASTGWRRRPRSNASA